MAAPESLRLVSLLPSATEILWALGLTDAIVGRSHECDFPPEIMDRPVCTQTRLDSGQPSGAIDQDVQTLLHEALSIYAVPLDVLQAVRPTHIVTQDQCDVCAVSFATVEAAVAALAAPQPQVISLQPHTLSDVWADIQRVADRLGVDAQPALERIHQRVAACQTKLADLPDRDRPTVALLEWTDPLMGSGNWLPELATLAGGRDVFGQVGQHSAYLSWAQLLAANPAVIVVLPCGFDLARTQKEVAAIAQRPEWPKLQAVQQQRVYLTDGNAYFNRPGPRLVDSLEILAEILHPERFPARYHGTAWAALGELT